MKILIGMMSHEGDSFSPKKSELIPEHCVYVKGDEIPKRYRGTKSKIGAMIEVAEKYADEICYTEAAGFVSSGCVSKAAFDVISGGIIKGIKEFKPDLIFLALHGACILEHCPDGEGLLLKMVRKAAGEQCIICSSFDMHAYMTYDMISNLNVLTGYKTYPHIDAYERALEAAEYAIELYKNRQKKIYIASTRVPLIVNAEKGQTDRAPIGPIIDYSIELEKQKKVLSTVISVMQPWMNVEYAGCTATVCAYDPESAIKYSEELARRLWDIRFDSQVESTSIREAIDRARTIKGSGKPVLFIDSADSPGAGGTCDSSYVAKHLIEYGNDLKSIGSVVDKEVAAMAWELEDGASIECDLGFKEAPVFGSPFHFTGVVERHCTPAVTAGGSARTYTFGKRVVLRNGNTYIMVMENAGCGASPVLYTSAGYSLDEFDVVCVRSALQYREGYEGLYSEDILVDSPGASSSNLRSLPFDKIVWQAYPFNEDAVYVPHVKLSVR